MEQLDDMSVPQSPVDGRRHGADSRIPRPSSLTSPMTSPVPLRRAGSLRLRGEKGTSSSVTLSSPRQKHFPTINESNTSSPRHHRSLQSLTPRRPSIGSTPNPADDDDNDSLRSFGSTQSACDHAHFARNGTTFSGRRNKYVVHCSPQHETEEYLTPTQRAARQERRLKALLAQARRDLETKDECIFRLTKEVVELRLLRGDAPPEGIVTEAGAYATDSRSRQNNGAQWTKSNGFGFAQSPVADSACGSQSGIAGAGGDVGDGPPSGLATPVSLSDSGHFDDALTAAAINGSSPSSALALDERRALLEHLERRLEEQARRHAERALEDRRALVELYERKMEEMSRRHASQSQEERRELEGAYEKRLIEAARALADEKERAETALRERDALKLSVPVGEADSVPAGLEKRLAKALQRLQVLQRSPSKEVKTVAQEENKWDESSIQRVEEALSNLEKRLAEERSKREEALKTVRSLSEEIGDLERRLADERKIREVALEEAEKLRESDLMNSVRVSDLETRLSEELRVREQNEGEAEALRERNRINEARLTDMEARMTDVIKKREEAVGKIEGMSGALSLKEVRLAESESSLSDEVLAEEYLLNEAQKLNETLKLQSLKIRRLEEMHLEKTLTEEPLLTDNVMKDAEELRVKADEALMGELERRLARENVVRENKSTQLNQVARMGEIESRISSEQRTQTEAVPSQLEELERRLAEEVLLREESVREVEQWRIRYSQFSERERELEENKLIRDEALREASALREKLYLSEARQEELETRLREDVSLREKEAEVLREAVAAKSSRITELEKRLGEEQKLREEISEEADLLRNSSSLLSDLKREVEEEKLIRQEAISQAIDLQERLDFSDARQLDLRKSFEEERRLRKEAVIEAEESREAVSLLSSQLAELQRSLAEGLTCSEDRQQEAEVALGELESLKEGLRTEWETRLTDLTLALEEEQRKANSCQSQLDQFHANVQTASEVSQDLESRLALATQAAEALEKDLGERLQQAEERCKDLASERDASAARIQELSNELKEQEERHKDINLEMYRKGQEAAKFERRDEIMLQAQVAPSAVTVPELLAQLESTEKELDKVKAMYRRLLDSQAGPSNPEATLMFLKSAFYYFLTDEANSLGHLKAIQSILGFTELERQNVETHTYFRR